MDKSSNWNSNDHLLNDEQPIGLSYAKCILIKKATHNHISFN